MRYLLIMLIAFVVSCGYEEAESDKWIKPESTTISCEEYFSYPTKQGVLTNNVWNKKAAESDSWRQCLEKRSVDGETQFGWSWSWPFGRRVIYSQPQIKIGSSPWAPEPKFDTSFPLKISALSKLDIAYDLEVTTNGNHNIATTMWLISEAYTGSKPNRSVIAAEIMIWTYSTNAHFDPAGAKYSEITTSDGANWEVWFQKEWQDKSEENDNRWVHVAFRATNSSMKADINGLELLTYAIEENLISEEHYIADVELGNEIMSGSGMTWVKKFDVVYDSKF
ncbi:glycoside hydrolase family 12 [Alteromonas gilva]|uniref:Glycoside hydrolase family 12 n=1 Tax=Alteromonas gilva TaxID=2987522 RepID=A0ABT5L2U4_9ALTE|nr:glycoside hydrolase family 12 [Alteromonas gilva]MDC8831355.1 glycoside hydrolase family 12 [Alteromonas gilva]